MGADTVDAYNRLALEVASGAVEDPAAVLTCPDLFADQEFRAEAESGAGDEPSRLLTPEMMRKLHGTDIDAATAQRVLDETGLLPHVNAGTLSRSELQTLRPVAASMGVMLESGAHRLTEWLILLTQKYLRDRFLMLAVIFVPDRVAGTL